MRLEPVHLARMRAARAVADERDLLDPEMVQQQPDFPRIGRNDESVRQNQAIVLREARRDVGPVIGGTVAAVEHDERRTAAEFVVFDSLGLIHRADLDLPAHMFLPRTHLTGTTCPFTKASSFP